MKNTINRVIGEYVITLRFLYEGLCAFFDDVGEGQSFVDQTKVVSSHTLHIQMGTEDMMAGYTDFALEQTAGPALMIGRRETKWSTDQGFDDMESVTLNIDKFNMSWL